MKKVTDFIVNHCYIIFAVFLAFTALCGVLSTKVKINKDIYSYMPKDSETSLGLEIMDDEFDYSSTSIYKMMLTDVPDDKKSEIKSDLESVNGVDSVEQAEKDRYTLYEITLNAPADSEVATSAYKTISEKYKKLYEVAEAGQVYDFNGEVLILGVAITAVAAAMVILIIMSKSWVEPWLYLFAILLAVVTNKGTNLIFPSVSHITDGISAILQMALSMDYAIMLSSRYRQEKEAIKNEKTTLAPAEANKTAMRRAMRYAFGAISSSSITTVVGLIVLVFMSFTIGKDMGLVLSKGVILSLLSIFTSLPALLLLFDKAIEKTKKPTINFNMTWFGKGSFHFRRVALPVFLFIFIGSFLLKGGAEILFTSNQNNKIKDIFPEKNQMALVYDKDRDDQITQFCYDYDAREDTTRVLCYGNTINEPEKYNEIVPKINDLSDDEDVEAEDYELKALYYNYYKDVDSHTLALDELVNFLQTEVFPNPAFEDEVTDETVHQVERFSNFTNPEKVNRLRTKEDIASVLEVSPSSLDDLYVLYLSERKTPVSLTLYDFASFVTKEILTDPEYKNLVSDSQKRDLAKLLKFSDPKVTDTEKSAAELADLFGLDAETVKQILTFYAYETTDLPTATLSIKDLVNFALSNDQVLEELNLTAEDVEKIKNAFAKIKTGYEEKVEELSTRLDEILAETIEDETERIKIRSEIDQVLADLESKITAVIEKEYAYSDYENLAEKITSVYDEIVEKLTEINEKYGLGLDLSKIPDLDLSPYLEKLKNIYKLYQAETTEVKLTPHAFVAFLLKNAETLSLTTETAKQLKLAKYIMDHQSTPYTSEKLAETFSLDPEKIALVYALYSYRHVDSSPLLSLKTLINFIVNTVLPNPDYASRLSSSQKSQIPVIATLMRAAEAGVQYNYDALYRAVLPLAGNLDKNQLFLVYLYHGSLYDYDESWTLTLEVFVNYLTDDILTDSRFAAKIDADMREKIEDGRDTIMEAKDLLVGPKHYRALIESYLAPEGAKTFSFIRELKDNLGEGNKTEYFVVGDSPMAYEISQTFSSELDFITILTMLSIFIVVVLTFRSIPVSVLLVLVIQCAVYIVMAFLSLTGSSIYFIALLIVQAILMGATIDYAILFTSYYIENRTYFKLDRKQALISTYNKSIGAILTSASILTIVTAIVGRLATAIAGTICSAISLGTFCATLIILLLLPALLATLDRWIVKKSA